jgi:hypothetical protein
MVGLRATVHAAPVFSGSVEQALAVTLVCRTTHPAEEWISTKPEKLHERLSQIKLGMLAYRVIERLHVPRVPEIGAI